MRVTLTIAALSLMLAASGCGGGRTGEQGSAAPASNGAAATVSKYDSGPRAGESPVDEAKAAEGEKLFTAKGCSACHAFGKKMSGPDLTGVAMRRTAQWMEHQILEPQVMVKEDPISRQLFAQYALQMPNQGLTQDEARAVIEYLKKQR